MSKNMAVACIEESLTSGSKNAHPVLDFQSHKLKNTALARVSLGWDTPEEAAVGLHRELAKELETAAIVTFTMAHRSMTTTSTGWKSTRRARNLLLLRCSSSS